MLARFLIALLLHPCYPLSGCLSSGAFAQSLGDAPRGSSAKFLPAEAFGDIQIEYFDWLVS